MCGRYAIYGPISRKNRDTLEFLDKEIEFSPRYNAAPTQRLPVYREHAEHGRELVLLRWGLVPFWAKDAKIGARMINARSDTVAEKPAFRAAFKRRRCLVPMAGFYEWQKTADRKVPHFIHPLNEDLFAAAGLYEYWAGKDGAEPIESYTILTTDANAMMHRVHDRMPVLLHEQDFDEWLDPTNEDAGALKKLLKPFPADEMRAYPVSTRVNSVRNNGPELVEPAG